jgi:hypothetical protein
MGLSDNPFSVLTILGAPPIRMNRKVNSHQRHGHALCARVGFACCRRSAAEQTDDGRRSELGEQRVAVGRALLLVRALTAFYVALGGFALTTFVTMAGAVLLGGGLAASRVTMAAAIAAGGLGGLIVGASLLVSEVLARARGAAGGGRAPGRRAVARYLSGTVMG